MPTAEELVKSASLDPDTEPVMMETAAMFVEPALTDLPNDATTEEAFFA